MDLIPHAIAGPPGEIIPIIAIVATFSVPIIAILVRHQQKMTELIHRSGATPIANPEVDALRREVAELKQLVQNQTITLDDIRNRPADSIPARTSNLS